MRLTLAQSRKRRKDRRRAAGSKSHPLKGSDPLSGGDSGGQTPSEPAPRGYARSRAKNEAARAALEPLAPGERPTAVTAGAIVAGILAAANLIAVVAGWDRSEERRVGTERTERMAKCSTT